MSGKDNTKGDTEHATVSVSEAFQFANGPLADQVPFRVHRKAGELLDRFAEKHGVENRTEYVRRVVYEKLAEELEGEAQELRRVAAGG